MTLWLLHFGQIENTWIWCPCVSLKLGPNIHEWQNKVLQSLHWLNDGRSFLQISQIFLSVIWVSLCRFANH